jgi:hypothetical protein
MNASYHGLGLGHGLGHGSFQFSNPVHSRISCTCKAFEKRVGHFNLVMHRYLGFWPALAVLLVTAFVCPVVQGIPFTLAYALPAIERHTTLF